MRKMNTFIARASSPNWSVSLKKIRHGMTWNYSICGKSDEACSANADNLTAETEFDGYSPVTLTWR